MFGSIAVMDNKSADDMEMNLRSLKQMDGSIDQIVMACGQCAVYKYSNDCDEWERKEIEGSMFVVRHQHLVGHTLRQSYGFVVINRLNTTNMCQTIDHHFDINVNVPYLLYKNSLNEIYCIWFYDQNDCLAFSSQLQSIIGRLAQHNHTNQSNHIQTQSNANPNDIIKKLMTIEITGDKNHSNGQNHLLSMQTRPTNQSQPQVLPQPLLQRQTSAPIRPKGMTLQVQDLFQTHRQLPSALQPMAAIAAMAQMAIMPPIPAEAVIENLEDPLNGVITPHMLSTSKSESSVKSQSPIVFNHSTHPSVTSSYNQNMTPLMSSMANKDKIGSVNALSMEQLKQTLIHLLQTDADFLHSIHTAYTNSIHK